MSRFNWRNPLALLESKWRRLFEPRTEQGPARRSTVRLSVETLEDRCVPASGLTFSQQYVSQVYIDVLHRPADTAGLAFWSGQLDQGISAPQAVLGIESSAEYRVLQVQNAYSTLLKRPADAASLSSWTQFLATNTVEKMQAGIASSAEYFYAAGQTNAGYVTNLYRDLLNRGVEASAQSFYGQELAAGMSRSAVATQILSGQEYLQNLVQSDYSIYLHRVGDPAGVNFYTGQLKQGATDQQVVAAIVGSNEYGSNVPKS